MALAIVAIGMTALLTAVGSGIGNAGISARYLEAARRAQSRLDALGTIEPLAPGEQGGDDGGGYRWRIRISPPAMHPMQGGPIALLYAVEVNVSWGEGGGTRGVSLQTERAGLAVGNAPHG